MKAARRLSWLIALPLVGMLATCSPVTGSDNEGPRFKTLETPNFTFVYTSADDATIDQLRADMDAMLARLKGVFAVDTVPVITVVLYPDRRSFQDANSSSSIVPGLTRGLDQMEVISPNAPNQVFDLWVDTRVEHMLTHLVTRAVNPDIANSPRWLWEATALYQSGQKTAVGAVEFFKPDAEPALSQLGGSFGTPIIDVGWYLGEYLDLQYGPAVVIELIETQGDLEVVLGLTSQAFIDQFVAFVRARYGLPD